MTLFLRTPASVTGLTVELALAQTKVGVKRAHDKHVAQLLGACPSPIESRLELVPRIKSFCCFFQSMVEKNPP
jgi:hypothetical protein